MQAKTGRKSDKKYYPNRFNLIKSLLLDGLDKVLILYTDLFRENHKIDQVTMESMNLKNIHGLKKLIGISQKKKILSLPSSLHPFRKIIQTTNSVFHKIQKFKIYKNTNLSLGIKILNRPFWAINIIYALQKPEKNSLEKIFNPLPKPI